jgi:hypothetical protein
MPRCVLCLLLILSLATGAWGATITVRKDGTGNYSVIQQALDAAANGDTILIGPGEYTDYKMVRLPGWTWDVRTYGDVMVANLVIVGAGAGNTIIGPVNYNFDGTQGPQGLTFDRIAHDLKISDITIRNCFSGLYFWGALWMDRCELKNNDYGIGWNTVSAGGVIRDSRFSGTDPYPPTGIRTAGGGRSVLENCEFANAFPYVGNAEITFRSCRLSGSVIGLEVADGAHCQLWDCDITDVGIGLKTFASGSTCEIHNSRIQGTASALTIDQRTSATVDGSSLTGGSNSVVLARDSNALTIHGCDFHKGTGPVIRSSRPAAWGAVTYDLTNNYWGTTDEAEIQSWIIDSNDDSSIYATVLYTPFAGQSVPSETTTWGDLKALFR